MNIELHITYRCSLGCCYCNRGCGLNQSHTPDMTFDQFVTFFTDALGYRAIDTVFFVGGEPTLHIDFERMVSWLIHRGVRVRVYSNQYTLKSRDIIERVKAMGAEVISQSAKVNGSVLHASSNLFCSPTDAGVEWEVGCEWAAGWPGGCGYSVDANGITACSVGGAIDGILGLGQRTWDWYRVHAKQLRALCRHCGNARVWTEDPPAPLFFYRGHRVSKTWLEALTKHENRTT